MTKKDLFTIILKLYGLYSVIELIIQIPTVSFYMYYDSFNDFNWLIILVPLISIFVVYLLLFKPDFFIRLLKLDQGFDKPDTGFTSMSGQEVGKIAFVVIAVYMIVSNLGIFFSQVVFSFKASMATNSLEQLLETYNPFPVNYNIMISSGLNLMVGFLLLTNYVRLSKWLDKLNSKNSD